MSNKTHTKREIEQAIVELINEGKIGFVSTTTGAGKNCMRRVRASKSTHSAKTHTKKTAKSSVSHRPGRYSILDGIEIGETRSLFGHSKYQVFSAISRRSRTHETEKYACFPVTGAFEVLRTQ